MESPFETSDQNSHSKEMESEIFQTKDPLNGNFVPDEFFYTERTIGDIGSKLQPLVDGFSPPNFHVCGPKGVGKTTATKITLEFLREEIDRDLNVIWIDDSTHESYYEVCLKLTNKICEENYRHGYPQIDLMDKADSKLSDSDGLTYIVIDNLETIKYNAEEDEEEEGEVIYELEREFSVRSVDHDNVGIIGISNGFTYHLFLKELWGKGKVKRHIREVTFGIYDANELRKILQYYADLSFKEGVLTYGVVPKCAALEAQDNGTVQGGLELLRISGEIAESRNSEEVTAEHVEMAYRESIKEDARFTFKNDLSIEEQLVCVIIMRHNLSQGEGIRLKEIHKQYCSTCESFGLEEVGKRRLQTFIDNVGRQLLIESTTHNKGRDGGSWDTYSLIVSPKDIIEAAKSAPASLERLISRDIEYQAGI